MPRIGRSGYLLFVATYIIDVNAHCWPFIKTPPYIRSTPLEDFIPPCSRRPALLTISRILLLLLPLLLLYYYYYYYYSWPTLCTRLTRSSLSSGKSSVSVVETHITTSRHSHRGPPLLLDSFFFSDACSTLLPPLPLFPRINFLP